MKKIIIALVLLPALLMAQKKKKTAITFPIDSVTNKIVFEEVVKVDGVSKDDLFVRAKEWFARTFVSANDVIQMTDKEAGKIIGKGSSEGSYSILLTPFPYSLKYVIAITTKDGRYKYDLSQFSMQTYADKYGSGGTAPVEGHYIIYKKGEGMGIGIARSVVSNIDLTSRSIIASLKSSMEQKQEGSKSKDDF